MRTFHHVLIVAILSSGIPLLTGCVSSSAYDRTVKQKNSEIRGLKKKSREQRQAIESLTNKNQQLKEEIETLRSKLDLAASAPVTKNIKDVVSQSDVLSLGDRGQLRLKGDLLFAPGSAEIKDSAKEALTNLASAIQNRDQTATLMIAGHTDDQPIEASAPKWKTDTNMELGAHRALNVFLFLKNKGINPENMYIASFGEYRPRVANNSSENRAKNRRVEIRLLKGAAHKGAGTQSKSSGGVNKGGSSSDSDSSTPQKGK